MLNATLLVVATVVTVARGWPQVSRIAIHKNVSGVSSATWTMMLIAHIAWIVWAGSLGAWGVAGANVLASAGDVAVLLAIARHSELSSWRPVSSAIGAVVATGAIYATVGNGVLSVALTTLTAVMVIPQVVKAYQTDPSGISTVTWWLAVVSSIAWCVYYARIGHPVLMPPNFVIFPAALLILGRIYAHGRSATVHQKLDAISN